MAKSHDEILDAVEHAIDTHPELTRRTKQSRMPHDAELAYTRDCWTVRVKVRNVEARGRGSSFMHDIHGAGPTPEQALEAFIERLPVWAHVLKS